MVRALVARAGKVEEPLVERGKPGVEVGDQPLRGRAPARQFATTSPSSAAPALASRSPSSSDASIPARPMPAWLCATSADTAAAWASIPPRISASASAERASRASIVGAGLGARLGNAQRGRRAGAFDMGEVGQQPLRRLVDDRVRLLRLGGKLADLAFEAAGLLDRRAAGLAQRFGHAAGAVLGLRQVGEQHADVGPRRLGRAVERRAMFGQGLRAGVEVAR